MTRAGRDGTRGKAIALAVAVTAAALTVDLGTKAWACDTLRLGARKTPLPGVLHFELSLNTGSAFGFFGDERWAQPVLVLVPLAAIALMAFLATRVHPTRRMVFVATGLVLGGALGNLHDRLLREVVTFSGTTLRGVVDFIVIFYAPGRRWPAFNVADVCLLVGTGVFMVMLARHGYDGLRRAPSCRTA